MTIEQIILQEIDESKTALDGPIDDTIYRREHSKRIELINWVLENMKNPNIKICNLIESKMNEIILKINQTYTIFEADKLYTELRVLDWIMYQFCLFLDHLLNDEEYSYRLGQYQEVRTCLVRTEWLV